MQFDGLLNRLAGIGNSEVTVVPSILRVCVTRIFCFTEAENRPEGFERPHKIIAGQPSGRL